MALGSHGRLPHATVTAMLSRDPYTALDAFLTEHRLCRPGLDDPDVSPILVALWCSCEARIAVRLPPGWRAAESALRREYAQTAARSGAHPAGLSVYRGLARMARDGITQESILADAAHLLVMEASGVFTPDEQRVLDVLRRYSPAIWAPMTRVCHGNVGSGTPRLAGVRC
jgi:hypothetical protein